jgi:hypothetical protein
MSREVYAWPEMTLYVFTGTTSGIFAYAESVALQVSPKVSKFQHFGSAGADSYTQRTILRETDKEVTLSIGALYAGPGLYGMLASGANISATINLLTSADYDSSTFTLWSARANDFSLQGSEGNIWKQNLRLIAPDVSGI